MEKLVKIDPKSGKIDFLKEMPDGSVVFTCYHAEIEVPSNWQDHKLAEIISSDVYIFAIFNIRVYYTDEDYDNKNDKTYFFKYITKIYTCPNMISEGRDENGEKTLILEYGEGDRFIRNKNIIMDSKVASTMLDLMTLGYFPSVIDYEDIPVYWTDVCNYNGVGLDSMSQSSIDLIVSELCRDPKNYARPYRHKYRDNPKVDPKDWKIINLTELPKYASVFASITSGDPKSKLISICSRIRSGEKQKTSPVEEAIM